MKSRENKGFTMAEMLIVTAIVIALSAVAFIAVQNYQRAMYQLEFDGYAREIYFAAQNHLTQAASQGLVKQVANGNSGTSVPNAAPEGSERSEIYCYAVPESSGGVLELMLPPLSVDTSSSRGAGSYYVLYQKSSAKVLDVFYSSQRTVDTRFGHNYNATNDSDTLLNLRGDTDSMKRARRNVDAFDNAIVGWYGGDSAEGDSIELGAPAFRVENAEKLKVFVTNPNVGDENKFVTLQLIVTGKSSGAKKTIKLLQDGRQPSTTDYADFDIAKSSVSGAESFELVLDDVTYANGHFANKFLTADSGTFNPGEDLEIQAKVFSTNILANIAWSATATTNSLFADPYPSESTTVLGSDVNYGVAAIANFRHFENLDAMVSHLDDSVGITKAAQTADLDWIAFRDKISGNTTSIALFGNGTTKNGCAFPVTPRTYSASTYTAYDLAYDGQSYSIKNVIIDFSEVDLSSANYTGAAGLFGTLATGSAVSNLELIDFDITGTTSAGALVGTAEGTTISNVVAYHGSTPKTVTASAGDAGGLIGKMTGSSKVEKSAAAMLVSGTANAGGLIGTSNGGSVTACYSGGHTISGAVTGLNAKYDEPHEKNYPVRYDLENFNVTASAGTAGGLIGVAGDTTITSSYSTCSAAGSTAGGFVGTSTGSITNCYCTGLVMKPDDSVSNHGAFAGSGNMDKMSNCQFFEIINEIEKDDEGQKIMGYNYLRPLGNVSRSVTDETKVFALDSLTAMSNTNAAYNYNLGKDALKDAIPYDSGLTRFYDNKYLLKTVEQLGADLTKDSAGKTTDFVKDHYGDWPAPEEFIFN